MIPFVREKYPMVYIEHARIEVDDSSIKVINSDGTINSLPVALLATVMLGPGTNITHEATKVIASVNCLLCYVGADGLFYYAVGISPTHDMLNARKQVIMATDDIKRTEIVRRMYSIRFPGIKLEGKSIQEMMGMEGIRVRNSYAEYANKYHVDWRGRKITVGNVGSDDITNRAFTICNGLLYSIVTTAIYHTGYLPQIGFVHTSGNVPFAYDIADLYKTKISMHIAFSLTEALNRKFDHKLVIDTFRDIVVGNNLMETVVSDIMKIMENM